MQQTAAMPERLAKTITNLSNQKLEQLTDFAKYLHSREEWEATMELLNDPGMRSDIEEGLEQAQCGETHSWRDIQNHV